MCRERFSRLLRTSRRLEGGIIGSIAARIALGEGDQPPRLWARPTYLYYRDEFYGSSPGRKVLVFSGWRFVPKAVAVILSRLASDRAGGADEEFATQPLRFTERISFHTFDVCFPTVALATAGGEAFRATRNGSHEQTAEGLWNAATSSLRRRLSSSNIELSEVSDPMWQIVMRLDSTAQDPRWIRATLDSWAQNAKLDGSSEAVELHRQRLLEWLADCDRPLRISESRLNRLSLIAAFSPACALLRALFSNFPEDSVEALAQEVAVVTLGPLRKYFNRPHVQRIIRGHKPTLAPMGKLGSKEKGFAERVLYYAAEGHLQAVLDEYVYLLKNASQCEASGEALEKLAGVWGLARGNPRTNGLRGSDSRGRIELDAHVHSADHALAFADDETSVLGPERELNQERQRKSIVREAFNSPFWPFVLATTSVGQEGLDFHLYCRAILHWNLPSNPVDLEQREGRLNRRDCLAIRESIARDWPS